MALALYRTYRPGSLAEVIGQEHVTEPLARALEGGRTHHAYLFSGPRGCGKTSTARILARSLNCAEGPTATPCGSCRSCVELAPNGPGSIDVVELDAATHRGIDDARELREKAIYAPAASRYKIYIIDEAHQLTNEAANALLKLVEEPPPHLRFIFATTEPDKIIPTIRSRTFHYGFRLVPARTLTEHLAGVCRAEGVPAEGPALAVVARAGAGSVRDSLSVLGQLLAGAGPDGLTYAESVTALGLTDATLIDAFVEALAAGSAAAMFGVVDRVISAGHDPRRFVADALDRLRDLIILRADPGAVDSGLVDVPDDAGERMRAQADSLGLAELSRAADLVSAGLGEMKGATAPRLQLELLCARLALPATDADGVGLLARIERLERGVVGAPAAVGPHPAGPAQEPARAPAPAARGRDLTESAPAPTPGLAPATAPPTAAGPGAEGGAASLPPRTAGPARAAAGPRPAPPPRPELRTDGARPEVTSQVAPASAPAPTSAPDGAEPQGDLDRAGSTGAAAPARSTPPTTGTAASTGAAATAADATPVSPAGAPTGTGGQVGRVQAAWAAILDRLARDSKVAWTLFHSAFPISLTGSVLAVAVPEPGMVRNIAQRGHDERLRQAIIDVLGIDVSVDVVHDPDASRGPGSPEGPGAGLPDTAPAAGPAAGSGPTSEAGEPPVPAPDHREAGRRGRDLVRAATAAVPEQEPADEPSEDDPDLEAPGHDGLALITRELGARPIGEIDHS